MTEKIDKYKVQAALVRSFFDAFSHGVIESQVEDPKEKTTPQSVKKLMLEHYEHIALKMVGVGEVSACKQHREVALVFLHHSVVVRSQRRCYRG